MKLRIEQVEGTAIDWTIERDQPCHDYIEMNVLHASLQTVLQSDLHQVPV